MPIDQGSFRFAITAAFLLLVAPLAVADDHASSEQQATGVVYHDRNDDQTRQPDEPGIPNVKVSNGLDVVTTDEAGRYTLPVDDETILFVVKPRDWMTPVNELNLPRFFYIHKPHGSPDDGFLYPGSEPTGDLPDFVDFPLVERAEDESFKVIMIGDPQPYDLEQVRFYHDDVIAELQGTDAAFAVALGDLVGDDLDLFEPYNQVNATVGIPFYNVLGNHDLNFLSPNDEHDDETFEATFGPADYAFEVADVSFVLLDNVRYLGHAGYRDDGFPITNNYKGGLTDRQLRWLRNYVATVPTDHRIVLLMHIPLISPSSSIHTTPQIREVLDILGDHPYTLSFSGHTHVNEHHFAGPELGYDHPGGHHHHNVVTASGSWYRGPLDERGLPETRMRDGAPNGYAVVTFNGGDDYRIRFKAAGRPDTDQLHIHLPAEVTAHRVGRTEVVVNVYNGTERSVTEMRILGHHDDQAWILMMQTTSTDPAYVAYKAQADVLAEASGRRTLPNPWVTIHLWKAPLPADLPPGQHTLEVRTTDLFGQTDTARLTLTVLPAPRIETPDYE
ncbi:MAG: calcineurin-like phosphoesterase family protein [Planctomycetota bacterium]